jgi:hypothetical protein
MVWRRRPSGPGAPARSSMARLEWDRRSLRRRLRVPQRGAVLLQRKHRYAAGVVHLDAARLLINLQHLYRAGLLAFGQDARPLLWLRTQSAGHSHLQQHASPVKGSDASEDDLGQRNRRRVWRAIHQRLQPKQVAHRDTIVRIQRSVSHGRSCDGVQNEHDRDTEQQLE